MITKDKSTKMLIFSLLIYGGTCAEFAPLSLAGEASPARHPAHTPHAQQGMTISIDPESGEMRSGSHDVNLQPSTSFLSSMSTSSQELEEVQSPDPGKGVKVNLQGRFQSPLVATRNAAGKLVIRHSHAAPDSRE